MTKGDREAWRTAYKVTDELLPEIIAGAREGDSDKVVSLFTDALTRVCPVYDGADHAGRLLLVAVCGMLEQIYREEYAKEGQNRPVEAVTPSR